MIAQNELSWININEDELLNQLGVREGGKVTGLPKLQN